MPRSVLLAIALRIIHAASLLVPRADRRRWRQEWQAEILHAAGRCDSTNDFASQLTLLQRSSGAFHDAAWLRRQFTGDAEMFHDIRHVARMLAARPVYTAVACGVLAISIGASAAVFSVVDTLLLRPLPYPDADRIVAIWERDTSGGAPRQEVASANFLDWRDSATSFEKMASAAPWSLDYTDGPQPEVFFGTKVSEGFFEILGLQPLLGRLFQPYDHQKGRDQIAVLSYDLWTSRFNADRGIIGRKITLDGSPFEVVGVLPAWFDLPLIAARAE